MELLIGCDPEVFVRRKADGHFVSAHGMIPGTKKEPFRVNKGFVQVDGMALEANPDPAKTVEEWEENISTVFKQLERMLPPGHEIVLTPTARFTKDHFDLQPPEAKELGCDPDYNAYTMEANPRPDNNTTMRTAAGHVHLGLEEKADVNSLEHFIKCVTLVKYLDWYLGVPSLLYDKDTKRRKMYGAPGAFRVKNYGLEYRVLSNMWLSSPKLIRWVFNQTKKCVEFCMRTQGMPVVPSARFVFNWEKHTIIGIEDICKTIFLEEVMKGFPEL